MLKVKDFKFAEFEKEQKEMADKFGFPPSVNAEPVDLYGHRVNLDMEDPTNLKKTAMDTCEFYGLEPSPTQTADWGVAEDDKDY